MAAEDRPLSQLVQQGWEVVGYSSSADRASGMPYDSVLLRRQKVHKILKIRRKVFGRGFVFTELDV